MDPIDHKKYLPSINKDMLAQLARVSNVIPKSFFANPVAGDALRKNLEFPKKFHPVAMPAIGQAAAAGMLNRAILPTGLFPGLVNVNKAFGDALNMIRFPVVPVFPWMADFSKAFAEMPPKLQNALLLLGKHGWYLDMDMSLPDIWRFEKALLEGRIDDAGEMLCAHYGSRLDDIEKKVSEKCPGRAKILASAFKAHRQGDFNLSIPVFFTQIDGVCKELCERYFFMKERGTGRPQTASYVEEGDRKDFMLAVLSPLTTSLPVAMSEKERGAGATELNRHKVMHGESLDYGTRVNGLKTISLLNYLAGVLRDPGDPADPAGHGENDE